MSTNSQEKASYRQIFKATSIFGGVQVLSIIVNLLKSKILALFVGAEGMGIYYLYQNPISLLTQITGLGINASGIRDVAQAHAQGDHEELSKTVITVRRWSQFAGLAGTIITVLIAKQLSIWSFGNTDYVAGFYALSLVPLFTTLGNGNTVVLTGMQRLRQIAFAGTLGAASGLIVSIPFFYYWGTEGIVPSLVVTAICVYIWSLIYTKKIKLARVALSNKETFHKGKAMVNLGIMMMLSVVLQTLVMYIVNAYLRKHGGTADVGLFQAGMQITNTSVALIFTAMANSYYPRLVAVCKNTPEANALVNQQAEIATIISTPILIAMMTFVPLLIHLFLSSEFLPITSFIHWLLLAAVLRACSWTTHYIIIAHGDTKLLFVLVTIANLLLLGCYTLGYHLGGLTGMGMGALAIDITQVILLFAVVRKRYRFAFSTSFLKMLLLAGTLCLVAFISVNTLPRLWMYVVNLTVLSVATIYFFNKLNERIEIAGVFTALKNRISKK